MSDTFAVVGVPVWHPTLAGTNVLDDTSSHA